MNRNAIATVYLKELRDSIRDKRTLIASLVIPTLIIPAIFMGAGLVMKMVIARAQQEATSVMIVGGENSPALVAAIEASDAFRVVPTSADFREDVSEKRIRIAIDIPPGFDAAAAAAGAAVPTVKIHHYEGEMKSGMGRRQMRDFLIAHRAEKVRRSLDALGLPASLVEPFVIEAENVAPPEKVGGNLVGGFVPYLIVIFCFIGAMHPAMDLTAGEKERGTMETLLCSPVRRIDIVLGKFLLVCTASVVTVALTTVMMGVSAFVAPLLLGGGDTMGSDGGVPMLIDPLGLLGVFAMVVPVAMLFSAVELMVALFAKSFKEAQSYVSPLMILVILPMVFGMLPGIELGAKTALVPILNLSLVCKEMLSGTWNWHFIALIFGSSAIYAGIALWLCVRMFNREAVLFRA